MRITSTNQAIASSAGTTVADNQERWLYAATVAQVIMVAYFIVINHVNLYPWNNLLESQLVNTLTGVVPFTIYIMAFSLQIRWLMLIGVVHSFIWLGLQLYQWWLPYLFGPTALHQDFSWYFENGYIETIRFLPSLGQRPTPDAQHATMELLSVVATATMTVAYLKTRRSRNVIPTHAANRKSMVRGHSEHLVLIVNHDPWRIY